ncbi:MAG: hypothetical protein UV46_C0042G0023, partial [Candidatus Gottesmanbacteria bacterium GW2011_GWC2_42_8]
GLQLFERQIPQKVSSDAFSHRLNIDFFTAGHITRDKVGKIYSFLAGADDRRASRKHTNPDSAVLP